MSPSSDHGVLARLLAGVPEMSLKECTQHTSRSGRCWVAWAGDHPHVPEEACLCKHRAPRADCPVQAHRYRQGARLPRVTEEQAVAS